MARIKKTADDLEAIAVLADRVSRDLRAAIEVMQTAGMPQVFIHWASPAKQYAPQLVEWAAQVRGESVGQAEAHKLGVLSRAERIALSNRHKKSKATKKDAKP